MTFRQIVNHLNHRDVSLLPKNKFFRFSLIIVSILFISLTTKYIFAATTSSNPYLDKSDAIKSGNNQESWLNEALSSNLVSLFNGITGGIPKEVFQAYESGNGPQYAYIPGGAFGNMNNMIAALYTPAASGIEYIAGVKDSFLGKPAYAQGVGFTGLQFLLPLWRGFRNLIYVVASLVFVGIGIMIMLRVKISPQAVITVQSAIPQLITTLILVTFSYAIAGLVIDICNLLQAVVVAILFSVQGKGLNDSLFPGWWGSGFPVISDILNGIGAIFTPENFNFSSLSNPTLRDMQMLTSRATPGWLSLTMLGGLLGSIIVGFFLGGVGSIFGSSVNFVGDIIGRGVGGVVGGLIGGLLIPIVLCIIVGIWLIKLYFGLIKCYVTLIFKIILGPLEIGAGAFPNAKIGFSSWILDVVSNMAVFPIIGIFLVLLNIVVDAIAGGASGSTAGVFSSAVWSPNLISANGVISPSILAACVGLAGLALLSKLPEMVPQFIFMIKPSPWGQAIGQGLGDMRNNFLTKGVERGAKVYAGNEIGKGATGRGLFGVIGGEIERVSSGSAARVGDTITKS